MTAFTLMVEAYESESESESKSAPGAVDPADSSR
jgi:hypothetical protein